MDLAEGGGGLPEVDSLIFYPVLLFEFSNRSPSVHTSSASAHDFLFGSDGGSLKTSPAESFEKNTSVSRISSTPFPPHRPPPSSEQKRPITVRRLTQSPARCHVSFVRYLNRAVGRSLGHDRVSQRHAAQHVGSASFPIFALTGWSCYFIGWRSFFFFFFCSFSLFPSTVSW